MPAVLPRRNGLNTDVHFYLLNLEDATWETNDRLDVIDWGRPDSLDGNAKTPKCCLTGPWASTSHPPHERRAGNVKSVRSRLSWSRTERFASSTPTFCLTKQ